MYVDKIIQFEYARNNLLKNKIAKTLKHLIKSQFNIQIIFSRANKLSKIL